MCDPSRAKPNVITDHVIPLPRPGRAIFVLLLSCRCPPPWWFSWSTPVFSRQGTKDRGTSAPFENKIGKIRRISASKESIEQVRILSSIRWSSWWLSESRFTDNIEWRSWLPLHCSLDREGCWTKTLINEEKDNFWPIVRADLSWTTNFWIKSVEKVNYRHFFCLEKIMAKLLKLAVH